MIEMKRATLEDARFLFDLRNLESNRSMFKDTRPVQWEDHVKWLTNKLQDSSFYLFIGFTGDEPIGQFRIEKDGDVSVSMSDKFKGQNLGWQLIRSGTLEYRKYLNNALYAVVKSENVASSRAFEKAGYELLEEFTEEHQEYRKYIYRN